MRDERAVCIGHVSHLRLDLVAHFQASEDPTQIKAYDLAGILQARLQGRSNPPPSCRSSLLRELSTITLPSLRKAQSSRLEQRRLGRPSRIVLLWPKLLLLPPLALYAIKSAYESRESLFDLALEAHDTVKAFYRGWLLEPVKDILNTVRARGDEGVIVRKEGVTADLDVCPSLYPIDFQLNYFQVFGTHDNHIGQRTAQLRTRTAR